MMYMVPSAWFIIDYPRYDPSITGSRERSGDFRDGVLVVDDSTVEDYLKSMQEDAVSLDELQAYLPEKKESLQPIFLIDFDSHRYVSWFFDIDDTVGEFVLNSEKGSFRKT
jgi:hypothetical protein